MTILRLLPLFLCGLYNTVFAEAIPLRISEGAWNHKSLDLMSQILDSTIPEYGDYRFVVVREPGQGRAVEELAHNRLVDLLWFATSREREEKLLPIRIPIEMGLLGYRVCLINASAQHKFNGINSLDEWRARKLKFGSGSHWPDTQVLRDNKLQVRTGHIYTVLFKMLVNKRFDCFSRSVSEIVREADFAKSRKLVPEQNLLFVYPMPTFIFVNKNNKELAERIHLGFKRIREKGIHAQYIKRYHVDEISELNLKKRKVIRLENHDLSKETRALLDNKSLWFDINSM